MHETARKSQCMHIQTTHCQTHLPIGTECNLVATDVAVTSITATKIGFLSAFGGVVIVIVLVLVLVLVRGGSRRARRRKEVD